MSSITRNHHYGLLLKIFIYTDGIKDFERTTSFFETKSCRYAAKKMQRLRDIHRFEGASVSIITH